MVSEPLHALAMDTLGPLNEALDVLYISVVLEMFTHSVLLVPMPSTDTPRTTPRTWWCGGSACSTHRWSCARTAARRMQTR